MVLAGLDIALPLVDEFAGEGLDEWIAVVAQLANSHTRLCVLFRTGMRAKSRIQTNVNDLP